MLERGDIDRIMGETPPAAPRRIGELSVAAATALHPAPPPRRLLLGLPPPPAAAQVTSRPMLSTIDHVGVAVDDLEGALVLYQDSLGMPLVHRETVVEQGVEAALLDVGDGHIELLAPLGPETAVGKFLAKRGPGMHHVAYRVDDVEQALSELAGAGVRLIDEQPRKGIRGSRVAFVHPASTGGVLTEIVQVSGGH